MHGQEVDLLDFQSSGSASENITIADIPLAEFGLPGLPASIWMRYSGSSLAIAIRSGSGSTPMAFSSTPGNSITATVSPYAGIQGSVDVLGFPLAGASGSLNFNVTAHAGLYDPFGYSRYYLSDIDHGQSIGQALLNDLDASLSESMSVQLKAWDIVQIGSGNGLGVLDAFSITHLEWDPNADYQLRADHTLWQMSPSGPVEVDSGVLAFSNEGNGSLMVLKTDGEVDQEGRMWHAVVAQNVLDDAVDSQGLSRSTSKCATQYGVDNAGNVFVSLRTGISGASRCGGKPAHRLRASFAMAGSRSPWTPPTRSSH